MSSEAILNKSLEIANIGDYVVAVYGAGYAPKVFLVTGISKNEWGGYLILKDTQGNKSSASRLMKPGERTPNGSSIGTYYMGPEFDEDLVDSLR